jgi:DHA2 family multidrug resistance protein-like MFS transporter
LPADAARAVRDSFAGAAAVSAQLGGEAGPALLNAARSAFVGAMQWTSLLGVVFAIAGVAIAAAFLPSRAAPPVSAAPATEAPPSPPRRRAPRRSLDIDPGA